ncbi:MAG: hypothetical protein K9H16_13000 [Bacteroidales bacterium]|nr:hypothetical protein [Bacteroidales bacterium]
MNRPILFEHIPKTGGVTLRGILQKVYGKSRVFLIDSNNPASSLAAFSALPEASRQTIRVIAGHGALMYKPLVLNPFTITTLRDPLSLFFSQFNYLKITKSTLFWKDVKKMSSVEEYLDYALNMGHDNLMTRFLSNSMQWTIDPELTFHDMEKEGEKLLSAAKKNMENFDAVVSLEDFDAGVFALSHILSWRTGIPLYKPSNRTGKKPAQKIYPDTFIKKLSHALRFDIGLYEYFMQNKLAVSHSVQRKSAAFQLFRCRQYLAKYAALMLRKN